MATQAKRKFTSVTTPAGTAIYPKLNTPDTKYKPLGEYSTKLKLSAEQAQPIIDKYEAELAEYFESIKAELMQGDGKAKAKAKNLKLAADKPFKPEYDDEGNETGDVIFNVKMPARIARDGKEDIVLVPDFFDAAGKQIRGKIPEIWGGSKLRIGMQLRPFEAPIGVGISLRLQAVQILELRSGGQRDAASYGFGAEEGGYTADDSTSDSGSPFSDDTPESGGQSSNEDF